MNDRLEAPYTALRLTFGLVPLLAGLDKFFNVLADWSQYLSPAVGSLLPFSPETFMALVGVVEVAVGLMVLTRWTRAGAYIAAIWLTAIALNLVIAGYLDIAVRDLAMAVAAYSLARLAEVREGSPGRARGSRVEARSLA